MSNLELRKQWEERITAFKASGLSTAEWSEINNIKVTQLRYWIRKFKSDTCTSTGKWVTLDLTKENKLDNPHIKIRIGDVTIELTQGFNPLLLTDVIRTLKSIC